MSPEQKKKRTPYELTSPLEKKQYYTLETDKGTITIKTATSRDLKAITAFEQEHMEGIVRPYTADDFRKIFKIGEIIVLRNEEKEIVGIFAITYGPQSHEHLPLDENDAYYAGILFHPDFQNMGLFEKIERLAEKRIRDKTIEKGEGEEKIKTRVKRIWTCTRPNNKNAISALQRAEFKVSDGKDTDFMVSDENDSGIRLIFIKNLDATEKIAGRLSEKTIAELAQAFGEKILKIFHTDDGRTHIVIKTNGENQKPAETK